MSDGSKTPGNRDSARDSSRQGGAGTLASYRVPKTLDGERLDRVLGEFVQGWSRSRLTRLVKDGCVKVAGEVARKQGMLVESGAELEVRFPSHSSSGEGGGGDQPEGELRVLFEDEHLIVIDKPPGLVAHPNEKYQTGTVADIAESRFGPLPCIQGEDRPGIVHRLDKNTSGLMVLGRTPEALAELKRQFKEREVEKTYLAICHGVPRFDSDWIETSIGPQEGRADRRGIVDPDSPRARDARTYYEVRERFCGFAFLACSPKTGRTHQIRVHLTSIDLPILGDRLYGLRGAHKVPYPASAPPIGRQALHAHALELTHPATSERMRFESPLPEDIATVLAWLRT